MLTRIEKYKSYREEIAKEIKLNKNVVQSEQLISKYKKKINKFNPNILSLIKNDDTLDLINGIFDSSQINPYLPHDFFNSYKILNEYQLKCVEKEKNELFFQLNNFSILTNDNKSLRKDWLVTNDLYDRFQKIKEKNNIFLQNSEKEKVKKNLILNFKNCSHVPNDVQQDEIKKYDVEKQFSFLNCLWQSAIAIFIAFFICYIILLIVITF